VVVRKKKLVVAVKRKLPWQTGERRISFIEKRIEQIGGTRTSMIAKNRGSQQFFFDRIVEIQQMVACSGLSKRQKTKLSKQLGTAVSQAKSN